MRSFSEHLAEQRYPDSELRYRWVPLKGYSASTAGRTHGWILEFGVVERNPISGKEGIADPFNPLKGQPLRPMQGWKPLGRLVPEGPVTQKVIDKEIARQREVWRMWRSDPAESGLPDAHEILAQAMRRLTGRA